MMTYSKLGYFEYHFAIICYFNKSLQKSGGKTFRWKMKYQNIKIPIAFHTFIYKLCCWSRASSVFILWQQRNRTSRAIFKLWNQVFIRSSSQHSKRGKTLSLSCCTFCDEFLVLLVGHFRSHSLSLSSDCVGGCFRGGVLPWYPSSETPTHEGFLITHLFQFKIIIADLFNMKVFRHSVLNLYATSGNLLCFLLVGVTQEIVFADLTFFISLALYTIKVDFKSNLLLKKRNTVRFNLRGLIKVLHDIDLLAVSWEKFPLLLLLLLCCCKYHHSILVLLRLITVILIAFHCI